MKAESSIWIVIAAVFLIGSGRAPIYLGVLEPPLDETRGQFHVRVAFRFDNGRWSAMPKYSDDEDGFDLAARFPRRLSWTIILNGKKLGQVSGVRAPGYDQTNIGQEDLLAGPRPPAIQDGAADFETWRGATRYRPLAAVSEPNYKDPDQWRTFDVPAEMRKQAAAAFRRETALDPNCDGKTTRSYPESAIQVCGKSYRSKHGDVLIAMRPDPRLNRCEGPVGDQWQSVWFHLKGDSIRRIGNSLMLLDIGDYNDDGVSKILFQYDGYNRDGYVLLDPRADSKTAFSWSYH